MDQRIFWKKNFKGAADGILKKTFKGAAD